MSNDHTTMLPAREIAPGDTVRVADDDWRVVKYARLCGPRAGTALIVFREQASGASGGFRSYPAKKRLRVVA